MNKSCLLLGVFLFCGCTSQYNTHSVLREEFGAKFSSYQKEGIDRAVSLWENAFGTELPEKKPAIVAVNSGDPLVNNLDQISNHNHGVGVGDNEFANTAPLAYTVNKDTIYIVVDRIDELSFKTHLVVLHELGHFYGLRHANEGLMYPQYNASYRCIDSGTLDKLSDIANLDRSKLKEQCF